MRRASALLIGLVVVALLGWSSIFIVNAREQALVLRFGEIKRVIREPGIYFKIPTSFVDRVQIFEDRLLSFDLEDIRVQVRDGRRYIVDAFVAFRIDDPRKFRENVSGSLEVARENMRTRLDAALRRVYGQRSFEAALSEQRGEMMVDVRNQLRPLATDVGIEIVDVRIKRTDLLQEVSQQTFERMRAERLAEAAQLRARGTELAARIRAEADREAVVTVAEAERQAEILRGQGDGERSRIFADAYQQDPSFFEFYRSMRAYTGALQGNATTFVLTPDSEFMRFFMSANGGGFSGSPETLPAPAGEAPPAATPSPEAVAPEAVAPEAVAPEAVAPEAPASAPAPVPETTGSAPAPPAAPATAGSPAAPAASAPAQ